MRLIMEAVQSGRYRSESEVVAHALSEFNAKEAQIALLKTKLNEGIRQADAGEFVEFSAEDVKREGRRRISENEGR